MTDQMRGGGQLSTWDEGVLTPTSEADMARARLVVAERARDAADMALLLDALGLS